MNKKPFDRYAYYHRAVQSTGVDCAFVTSTYKELKGKKPKKMREDFCGAFALCCEWARRSKDNHAYGIDLDNEPLSYGRKHYLPKLRLEQQKRVHIQQGSVLTAKGTPV
ncbi:MAG: class I SAM-dependent methyltransferase, partial [Bdellovibrionales bacterium]